MQGSTSNGRTTPKKGHSTPKRREVIAAKRTAIRRWRMSDHPGAVMLRSIYPVN